MVEGTTGRCQTGRSYLTDKTLCTKIDVVDNYGVLPQFTITGPCSSDITLDPIVYLALHLCDSYSWIF